MSVVDLLAAEGVRLRSYAPGNHYAQCPKCSETRSGEGKRKPCLSVAIGPVSLRTGLVEPGRAVFHCFHCGATGAVGGGRYPRPETPKPIRLSGPKKPERRSRWW
jgi:hypothetical protein